MRFTRRSPLTSFQLLGAAAALLYGFSLSAVAEPNHGARNRAVLLTPVPAEPSWRDLVFFCAVPAAGANSGGRALVLAVDPEKPWRPELLDFLRRYDPDALFWIGDEVPPGGPEGVPIERVAAGAADQGASAIASRFFGQTARAVAFEAEDRSGALSASALAARLSVPLFPVNGGELSAAEKDVIAELGIKRLLYVARAGPAAPRTVKGIPTTRMDGALGVIRWLRREGMPVEYLAAANPRDAWLQPAPKLSFAAVLLAAGRNGAVAPLSYETLWKRPHPAAEGEGGIRSGMIPLGNRSFPFSNQHDPASNRWVARVDLNADGKLDGEGEGPFATGDTFELANRTWSVDLDVLEKERGSALWLTSPAAETIVADLKEYLDAAQGEVSHLCLVGRPEAIPMVVMGNGQGVDADMVSDLPLADLDDDPFVELAYGRVLAEDVQSATLLACRSLAYSDLLDPSWADSFATAEWEHHCAQAFEAAGFRFAGHHDGKEMITADSPLTHSSVVVHGSHAMWTVLGATYSWDSGVLLAPCFVESSGCSTASVDQDPEYRSVAARMLRNGAVAFIGNTRRGVAQQEYFRSELWNALLAGATLGQANRHALNRLTVAVIEEGEQTSGMFLYQLRNHAVYGDPALMLHLPGVRKTEPARTESHGSKVTLFPPGNWWRYQTPTLEEWGSEHKELHSLRGAGLAIDSRWDPVQKTNKDVLWFTAEARTRRRVVSVKAIGPAPPPLTWTGRIHVDTHADGTNSVLWRCRMVEFDDLTGEIGAKADALSFRLEAR